jgi:ATP-dependent DNA helicase RecG
LYQKAEAPSIGLDAPVEALHGVGPKKAQDLQRLGLSNVSDLLLYFPRAWQDRRPTDLSKPPDPGATIVVRGKVAKARAIRAGASLAMYKIELATGERKISAVWFKHVSFRYDVFAPLKKDLVPGADAWVVGRAEGNLLGIKELKADEYYLLDDPDAPIHVDRLAPVYALTEGVTQNFLRGLAYQAVSSAAARLPESLPFWIIEQRQKLALSQAVAGIHFPGSWEELEAARARLAYDELLLLELAWILKRRQTRGVAKGFNYDIKRHLLTPFREKLGFELTGAQKHVINEIFTDMQRPHPMTRLLQGDVGAGKTVVAISALLLAVENGYQAALMAPTEILAEQHRATLDRTLKGLPVKVATLSSRLSAKERGKILAAVEKGEIDVVVGTHALLEGDVKFPRLRLAVIDEQHRFGVRQRTTLRQKGSMLDLLIMTATPIPRTLALALYGDLEVSTLDQMPPGKVRATTKHTSEGEALEHLRAEVAKGRQGFIVYPIIDESSTLDLQSAKAEFERLREGPLKSLRLALIHGGLSGKTKNKIMEDFAAKEYDALVATSVIEVGIDVPNATVMIVQNADHFGMSSLHQLRGRIGRSNQESTCFLIAEPKTDQARRRVETLVATNDGFRIGEEDLKLRGPGTFLGTEQHGDLSLKAADLFKDASLLAEARQDAETLLAKDPRLEAAENARLRARLLALYRRQWNWIDLA